MKYFFLLCFIISSSILSAQSLAFLFNGTIENQDLGKSESGVSISIIQNGTTISSSTSASNGKYTLKGNVDYSKPFSVVFSKAGMVSKKVDFNLTSLNEEDIPAGSEYQPLADLSLKLFAIKPEVDFSFLNTEAVAKFDWDINKSVPDLDKVAAERTRLKIEKLLNQAGANNTANEAKYQAAIKEGESLYLTQKKYEEALVKYEEALTYKPKEALPIQRINELDALIQAQKKEELANNQADSEYLNLIKAADLLRDQKKFDQSIAKYKEAIVKKNEQYPQDQIVIVEGLKKEAENQTKYLEAVKAADAFFIQKNYLAAKEKYTLANKLKSSEPHPIARLSEIEKKIGEQSSSQEKKKKYEEAVVAADALFASGKWEEAKAKYTEALTFDPAATYPVGKIRDCDAKIILLGKDKEKTAKITKLLGEGDVLFTASKWNEAKLKYNEVLVLDATNAAAKQKLIDIAKKLEEVADTAGQEAKFKKLVTEGDLAVKSLKYSEGIVKYEQALIIKKDPAVQVKLDDANNKIKDLKDKEDLEVKFQTLKSEGMKLATEQQWLEAKTKLTEALNLRADAAITLKLKEIEAKIQANQTLVQLEKDYQTLITVAQTKETTNDLDGAIAKYKEASLKKPLEQMPQDKIKELEALKLNSSKQKEIDVKYNAFIKKGDDLMVQKNYLGAIKEYNEALALKPTENEPFVKASEAERLEKAKSSEGDEQYEKILTVAQTKIDEKDFVKARELADRALKLRPADIRPKELFKKIDTLEKQEKDYKAKMIEAEQQATAKQYKKAIVFFEQAKTIKPEETKPQERIDALTILVANQSSQAEKDALYKDYMTKGGLSQTAKSYEQALSHYQNALSVKENDQIAKDKISEIQQIIDNIANASKNEIDRKNQFDALVVLADGSFSSESYEDARSNYDKALELDRSSLYVKKQIDECIKRQSLKNSSLANAEYDLIIKSADEMFGIKSYDKAKENYNKALEIRPTDKYPKRKLEEIDAILNPAIINSAALKDLGEPYDNSIMDGYAALVKADLERKSIKNEAVKSKIENIKDTENELSELKALHQQATTNEIYMVQSKIAITDEASDLNRQLTVDVLRAAEKERDKIDASDGSYERSENLRTQEALNTIVEESAIDYQIRESVYTDNTQKLTSYTTDYTEKLRLQAEAEGASSISADQKLIAIKENIVEGDSENAAERRATENLVKEIVLKANIVEEDLGNSKHLELLTSKEEIEKVEIQVSEKSAYDAKIAQANEEELKVIKNTVIDTDNNQAVKQISNSEDINEKIDVINTSIEESNIERDLNRLNTTEVLHDGNNTIEQAAFESYSKETVKHLQNKRVIENHVNETSNIDVLADEKHAINVSGVDQLDKKANIVNEGAALSDDEERMRARAEIEIINTNIEENSAVSTDKQIKNSSKIEDVNRSIDAGTESKGSIQTEKYYTTQAQLNKIESKQPEKVRIENSMGQEYPEGVSQESFTQSDENGLMTAIITRRIVVIGGQGNVYVRTQKLDMITYSKNDNPTTEYTWQKETQGPHLEKHY